MIDDEQLDTMLLCQLANFPYFSGAQESPWVGLQASLHHFCHHRNPESTQQSCNLLCILHGVWIGRIVQRNSDDDSTALGIFKLRQGRDLAQIGVPPCKMG